MSNLRHYVSLGRAVGCTATLCTRRSTNDAIDSGAQTLPNDHFALHRGDRQQAEAILGLGTLPPGGVVGPNNGRASCSNGGQSRAFKFYGAHHAARGNPRVHRLQVVPPGRDKPRHIGDLQ